MNKMNPIAKAVYDWESSISDKRFVKEAKKRISELKTKQEVIDYYLDERGFDSRELLVHLLHFVITLP